MKSRARGVRGTNKVHHKGYFLLDVDWQDMFTTSNV